jgi:NitT/TauT family transport system permease protein
MLTTKVSIIGLGIACLIGFFTAILMSQAKWLERSLYPWAVFTQTVPILALVPIIGFWFGFNITARIIVVVIISIFPIIINTLTGLLGASRDLHDLLTLHKASRWTRATKLMIPYALPDLFTGLRTSAGLAIIGSIVGDFFFGRGSPGLGMLLKVYGSRLRTEELLSATIVACLLGVFVFWSFSYIGRRMVGHWSEAWSS